MAIQSTSDKKEEVQIAHYDEHVANTSSLGVSNNGRTQYVDCCIQEYVMGGLDAYWGRGRVRPRISFRHFFLTL